MSEIENPYIVPPFDGGLNKFKDKYVWWSWHPCYPYWAKSCWESDTKEEALDKFDNDPYYTSLHYYHNKLIKEGLNGYEEVADKPCTRLDVWKNIYDKRATIYNHIPIRPESIKIPYES